VIYPRLIYPLVFGSMLEKSFMLVPLIGAVLIFMKISPRLAGMARFVMAFLVGVGAAVTIYGAVAGTLIPQVMGAITAFDMTAAASSNISIFEALINGSFIIAGTVFTLTYFHFGARPNVDGSMRRLGLIEISARVGRVFIGITLGAVFAGVYAAALTALIERFSSLIMFVRDLL
jgi:hypothetical protein